MKNRKYLMFIPIVMMILCTSFLLYQNSIGLNLDIDLAGGTQITADSPYTIDSSAVEELLEEYDTTVRTAYGITGHSIIITAEADIDGEEIINKLKQNGYDIEDYSIQVISPVLGASFFKQAKIALTLAFIFMAIVIFFTFRSAILGIYTSLCPAFDIIETLAVTQLIGIDLSLASFAALLMIVGYSVDDDVVLASRVLKRGDVEMDQRFKASFKTSMTTHSATFVALGAMLALSLSPVITQIAAVLLIGLMFDFMNTWLLNANLLRYHVKKKGLQ